MKKVLLLSTLLGFAVLNAQMLVKKLDGTIINDGAVYSYNTYDTDESMLNFTVVNTSATQNISVKVLAETFNNTAGENFEFCFGGNCMPFVMLGFNYPPNGYTIAPGSDSGDSDHFWNKMDYADPMSITFKIYQVDEFQNEIGTPVRVTYAYDKMLAVNNVNAAKEVILKSTIVNNSIELSSKNDTTFQLFDMNGKLVKKGTLKSGENSINVQNLTAGIYIFNTQNTGGKSQTQKIIKK
ncbi:T9SS type A sorting domain-containing protein [Kaistella palustris]|uniref:T9SS type A sorting domain-containing protein n=1 Tax=Kaistella palustris TaxID=493376 RepID=UPI0003FF31B0|nr:T9SS type A sorting domain-containing protein [Kaistella palustris]